MDIYIYICNNKEVLIALDFFFAWNKHERRDGDQL